MDMSTKRAAIIGILVAIASSMHAYAFGIDSFRNGLSKIGESAHAVVSDDYAALAIVVILGILLEIAAINSAIKKVKIFEGQGGAGVSNGGKVISIVLSVFTWVAILRFTNVGIIIGAVQSILGKFGIIVGIIIGVVSYLAWRKAFPKHPYFGFMIIGLLETLLGIFLIESPIIALLGIASIILGLLLMFRARRSGQTGRDTTELGRTVDRGRDRAARDSARDEQSRREASRARQQEQQAGLAEESAAQDGNTIARILREQR